MLMDPDDYPCVVGWLAAADMVRAFGGVERTRRLLDEAMACRGGRVVRVVERCGPDGVELHCRLEFRTLGAHIVFFAELVDCSYGP